MVMFFPRCLVSDVPFILKFIIKEEYLEYSRSDIFFVENV